MKCIVAGQLLRTLLYATLCMGPLLSAFAFSGDDAEIWYRSNANGELKLKLYFFWSTRCPHCANAQPFVARLADEFDWVEVESLELMGHPENVPRFIKLAARTGQNANSVPVAYGEVGFLNRLASTTVAPGSACARL